MQTELDRIRLRTSHRFWPAVLFLPLPVVLVLVLLLLGLKPLPYVAPSPVNLETCSSWNAAQAQCDPLMTEWVRQLPSRQQYLAWTAHDIYQDVAADLPADATPEVIRERLLARRDEVILNARHDSRGSSWLTDLPTAHEWDQVPPAPPEHVRDAIDLVPAMAGLGERYELKRVQERMARVNDVAAWQAFRRYQFQQAMQSNGAIYGILALGSVILLAMFAFILRARPRDVVLTPHDLRIGRRRIPLRDIEKVDVDDHGATIRLRSGGKVRFAVDDPATLLEFLPELEAALEQRTAQAQQALPEPPHIDEDLAALRARPRQKVR